MGKQNKKGAAQPVALATVAAEPVEEGDDPALEEDEEGSDEEEELELLQVDVGDMIKVKQVLDETVANVVLEFVEDHRR